MSQYSEMMGSFIRTGSYPLEANYIFESEQELKLFYSDELNKTILHKGLFKIVASENRLILYWVVDKDGELLFKPLLSGDSIEELFERITELRNDLDQEVLDRILSIIEVLGTTDKSDFKEGLDNLLDISNLLIEVRDRSESNLDAIKAVVGTDLDDIISYLSTLDYLNLTEISEVLNKFFNTIDDTDTKINTLPELLEFLHGFTHTKKLYEVLVDLWNNIQGDPTPNTLFRTLRGILDFIEALASANKNRMDNIQKELDQTQIGVGLSGDGSYNSDKETYYLKDATSVMNALKILDSLINQAINNCNLEVKDTNSVDLTIDKYSTETILSADVKISSQEGNGIITKTDGLFYKLTSEYSSGTLTLKVNDNIVGQHSIGLSAIVESARYDSDQEALIFVFKLLNGSKQELVIPVSTLIREWEVDNSRTGKVVVLEKTESVGDGHDLLSADVRLFVDKYNILVKRDNTLYVKGTTDNLVHHDLNLEQYLDSLESTMSTDLLAEIDRAKAAEQQLSLNIVSETNRATAAELQLSQDITNLLASVNQADEELDNKINLETNRAKALELILSDQIQTNANSIASHTTKLAELEAKDIELDGRLDSLNTATSDLLTALNNEITRSTNEDNKFKDDVIVLTDSIVDETNRAVTAETQLLDKINTLKTELDNNTASDNETKTLIDNLKLADVALADTIALEELRATNREDQLEHLIEDAGTNISNALSLIDTNTADIANIKLKNNTLDAEITVIKSSIETVKSELLADIANETARATAQETAIDNKIDAEIIRATLKEDFIEDKIDNHISDYNNPHKVTSEQLGVYTKEKVDEFIETVTTSSNTIKSDLTTHLNDYSNPHKVTKELVGLGKVDNTSDLEKPISLAVLDAIHDIDIEVSKKATITDLNNHVLDKSNPHNVTKEQVGLGNVDNTSDMVKPISLATLAALDKKSDVGHKHVMSDITDLEVPPVVKGFVTLLAELPNDAKGGDKYILISDVGGVKRYTLVEYDGKEGTWRLKLLTTGNTASIPNGDVYKLNASGPERIIDQADYLEISDVIKAETLNLILSIEWDDSTSSVIRLKITTKKSYSGLSEANVTNVSPTVSYINIEKQRFISSAYSRPATLNDVNEGYASKVGTPVLVVELTTGNEVIIDLTDTMNIYDPVDTPSIDMSVSDWTGDPATSYKISANVKIAENSDAVKIKTGSNGIYALLDKANTNSINLSDNGTLTADLRIDNSLNNSSDVSLSIGAAGLSAKLIWSEYD